MSMDELLEPIGLTVPQYNVLSAVQLQPGISNAALARGAFVTAQSMQGIVANLERIGLLCRKPHPTHGRIRQSELTEKGDVVLAKAHKLLIGVEEAMTSGFKKEEIEALRSLLHRCAENMHAV
jgi:DNA-binding MarR family transcriptional regulator